jgi:superfamily I DNA/RNA helicase
VEKAKRLSHDGHVLFLCFNRFLVDELQNSNLAYKNSITFSNLPALVKSYTKMLGVPDDDSITLFLYDAIDNWKYQHIIIDEGQDFNEEHLEILSAISKEQKGAFYVFYDEKQLVHRQWIPDCLQKAECRLVLRRNCRNTRKIATTSGSPIGVEPVLWERVPAGKIPELYILPDNNDLLQKLSNLIIKYNTGGIPSHQITILTAKTEEKSALANITKIGKQNITRVRNKEDALFTTIRKFKGLEATVIILIDVDADSFATPEARNLLYVGTSRAKHFLDIISIADEDELSAMVKSIVGREVTGSARSRQIAASLKVKINNDNLYQK